MGNSALDYGSILKLRRDNISLQSDLEVANATIKKLEARISELQNDKASLITAIRIVQQDNGQSQTMATQQDANPWAEAKTKAKAKGNIKRKNKKKRKHDDHDNPGELNANTNQLTQITTDMNHLLTYQLKKQTTLTYMRIISKFPRTLKIITLIAQIDPVK